MALSHQFFFYLRQFIIGTNIYNEYIVFSVKIGKALLRIVCWIFLFCGWGPLSTHQWLIPLH